MQEAMLQPSARLLALLSLLQLRREWTGQELAGRFEVEPRTIRRDIDKLRALGYPVHAARGVAGGYRLGAGARLPPLLLDDAEAVAVAVGLSSAAAGSIAGVEEPSVRALGKLEQVLPERLRRRVRALGAATSFVSMGAPAIDGDVLAALAGACREALRARFSYVAGTDARHSGSPNPAPSSTAGSTGTWSPSIWIETTGALSVSTASAAGFGPVSAVGDVRYLAAILPPTSRQGRAEVVSSPQPRPASASTCLPRVSKAGSPAAMRPLTPRATTAASSQLAVHGH